MNLKWTQNKYSLLYKQVERLKILPSGVSCIFIPLTKATGLKLYTDKRIREFTYFAQQKAWQNYAGPAVGSRFTVRNKSLVRDILVKADPDEEYFVDLLDTEPRKMWGYVTQRAIPCDNFGPGIKYTRAYAELLLILKDIGFDTDDMIGDNLGFLNGELVAIDFDPCSISKGLYSTSHNKWDYELLGIPVTFTYR